MYTRLLQDMLSNRYNNVLRTLQVHVRVSAADKKGVLQLLHGVHGRLDDGRCLVEKLLPDEHGVVRFRLAPEEPLPATGNGGLAEPSSPAAASPQVEAAQVTHSSDSHAAAVGAAGLSYQEDITPAQNFDPAELPALQPRPASASPRGKEQLEAYMQINSYSQVLKLEVQHRPCP